MTATSCRTGNFCLPSNEERESGMACRKDLFSFPFYWNRPIDLWHFRYRFTSKDIQIVGHLNFTVVKFRDLLNLFVGNKLAFLYFNLFNSTPWLIYCYHCFRNHFIVSSGGLNILFVFVNQLGKLFVFRTLSRNDARMLPQRVRFSRSQPPLEIRQRQIFG